MRTAYGVAGLLLTLSVALAEEAPDWIKSPDPSKYLLTAAELPQLPAVAGEITVYPVGFGRLRDKKGDYWGPRLHRGLLSQTFTNPDQPERQATVQVRVHETPFYALFTWRYEMRSQHEDRQTALDDLYQNGGAGKPNPSGVWQHVGNLIIGISGNWQPFEDAYRDALLRKHASAHSVPQRRAPCAESRFFYTAEQLEGYYTDQPSLLYEPDQIVSDLRGALQRYARDGGRLQAGVGLRDAVRISLAFQTGALPTGHEAALHEAGRALAATRPGGRIDAGDLLYLSLKLHQGDVRSALLCCHAALYRGDTTNAPFINTTLRPIRNAAGYSDQKVAAKGRGGTELNARQAVGSDHQGPYYHGSVPGVV